MQAMPISDAEDQGNQGNIKAVYLIMLMAVCWLVCLSIKAIFL